MLWRASLAGLLVLGLGGQLDAFVPPDGRPQAVVVAAMELPDEPPAWTALAWPADGHLECPAACSLKVPNEAEGDLWLTWDGTQVPGFAAALDEDGGRPAFDAVRLGKVEGGEAVTLWGAGRAELVLLPHVDDVPELAALVPASLGRALPGAASLACLPEEAAAGLTACLRFTTGVANLGDAPLDLRSEPTGEPPMVQRLPDGERMAGVASYHAAHGHFHYARFIAFEVHAVDEGTGLRGPRVLEHAKTGFCMVDFGEVHGPDPLVPKTYWRDGCEPFQRALAMGLNPGWYDIYRWFLPDQAIDPSTLAPGLYELVVTVDPDGTLTEGHTLDNKASLVFRWDGASATPVEGRGLVRLAAEPS